MSFMLGILIGLILWRVSFRIWNGVNFLWFLWHYVKEQKGKKKV